MCFSTFYYIVESLQTICSGINLWLLTSDERLKPNIRGAFSNIVEAYKLVIFEFASEKERLYPKLEVLSTPKI